MPHLVQMDKKYAKKGMVMIGAEVQGSDSGSIKKILDEHKVEFPVVSGVRGPSLSRGIPHTAVFDVGGKLVHHGHPSDPATEKAIKAALKEAKADDAGAADDIFAKPTHLVEERQWKNAEGKTLTAALVSLEGNTGTFRFPNGRIFKYDIGKLSDEDQALIKEKAAGGDDED